MPAARDIYDEWSACHHFTLYDEVPEVLRGLHARRLHHRADFEHATIARHLRDGISSSRASSRWPISSSDHGFMKPHPSIFEEALRRADVTPAEAVMVGDSFRHDIEGARRLGMRGVLVARSRLSIGCPPDIPVIQSLRELRALL